MIRLLVTIPVAALVILLLHADTSRTYACSCAPPRPPLEALATSEAVFAGKVVAVSGIPPGGHSSTDPRFVTFKVSKVWKGPSYEVMFITTPLSEASCGFTFVEGGEYIVYAWQSVDVLLCSRTGFVDNAQEDLEALGEGSTPEAGSISPIPKSRPDHIGDSSALSFFDIGALTIVAALIITVVWFGMRRRSHR